MTRVVAGRIDLNGDRLAGSAGDGITADDGRLAGLEVVGGEVLALGSSDAFTGLINGELVFLDGLHDLQERCHRGRRHRHARPAVVARHHGEQLRG